MPFKKQAPEQAANQRIGHERSPQTIKSKKNIQYKGTENTQ